MSKQLPISTCQTLTYIPLRWDLARAEAAVAALLEKGGRDESARLREEGAEPTKIAAATLHEAALARGDAVIAGIVERLNQCDHRPPTFRLRVSTIRQDIEWEAELGRWGAIQITNDVYYEEMADTVRLEEPANQEFLLELLEEAQSGWTSMPADRQRALQRLERKLAASAPEIAEMTAAREKWANLAPICAFRHFVTGWDNLDPPYRRDALGLVDMEIVDALPLDLTNEVGWFAIGQRKVNRDQEKNSESRPRKAEARPRSEESAPLTAGEDGTSTASDTTATPLSG